MCALNDMRDVFSFRTLGATIVLPFFPAFYEFSYATDLGDMFDHPAAFGGA
jgi:hypothetical protein